MNFAFVVRDLRKMRHLTQMRLAENAGLSVSTIIRIEEKNDYPNMITAKALAEALGVKTSELVRMAEQHGE